MEDCVPPSEEVSTGSVGTTPESVTFGNFTEEPLSDLKNIGG